MLPLEAETKVMKESSMFSYCLKHVLKQEERIDRLGEAAMSLISQTALYASLLRVLEAL
jgi:hypothetical protein